MSYSAFASFTIILSLIAIYFFIKLVGRGTWILAWVRGTVAVSFLILSILLVLTGLDLLSYKQLLENKPLGTISFAHEGEQSFVATLTLIDDGSEENYAISGDQWQIDARIISWTGMFRIAGAKPGYRLDRLSGRYYSLEDEHRKKRTVHQLSDSEYWVDMWSFLHGSGSFMPLVDAVYGSATYLPMEDGAFYRISLSANGLLAEPMNDVAEQAISRWK
ncbi:hypothetical protein SAMN02745866_02481 [Alteromonadaceae bacterium Bs31]|nr:hypothetical protein SAMN02745866_02481 [Alteromonadaceae bacterium Bs31]